MREKEMRMRVFRFLKARMRNMIMPATVGLGLAVGGCAKEGSLEANSSDAARDFTGFPVYSVAFPDSGPEAQPDGFAADNEAPGPDLAVADSGFDGLPVDSPVYGVPFTDAASIPEAGKADAAPAIDQGVALDGARPDSSPELGSIITKYIAPMPDAAADQGSIAPMYTAVMPDAATDSGLPLRYAAVMPDAGADRGLAVLYMAPVQA